MKLVLSLVVALFASALPTMALAWPDAGGSRKSEQLESCETILQLEVFDTNVHPPFAHVKKWLKVLKDNDTHKLQNRTGNVLTVVTTDPNGLMTMIGNEFPPITKVLINGQPIATYSSSQAMTVNEPYRVEQRNYLYKALEYLPEGAYDLVDSKTGKPITMFVSVQRDRSSSDPLVSLSVTVEVWPGTHSVPQSENHFHEKSITTVTSASGVDLFYVSMFGGSFSMGSSYGQSFQRANDEIKFNFGDSGQIASITTKNLTYNLVGIRPLRHDSRF